MTLKYLKREIEYLEFLKHDGKLDLKPLNEKLKEFKSIVKFFEDLEPKPHPCNKVDHNLDVVLSGTCKKCGLYHTI